MRVTAHQPDFLPWIGFWNKVITTDVTVLLDQVQISKGEYHNRVKIDGVWVTLPLFRKGAYFEAAYDPPGLRKVITTLEHRLLSKRHNPYAQRLHPVMDVLSSFENAVCDSLLSLNVACLTAVARILDLDLNVVFPQNWQGDTADARLRNGLSTTIPQATAYYSGAAGIGYLNPEDWAMPLYIQQVIHPYGGNSILQLIAREAAPIKHIKECAAWTRFSCRG